MTTPLHEICYAAGALYGVALIAEAAGDTTVPVDTRDIKKFVRMTLGALGVELVDDEHGSTSMAEGG